MRASFFLPPILGWIVTSTPLFAQAPAPDPGSANSNTAHLRVICSHPGDNSQKSPGDWPSFRSPLELALTGTGPDVVLVGDLIPITARSYFEISSRAGKLVVREKSTDPKNSPKVRTTLSFVPKPGRFYTLVIGPGSEEMKMEVLEDEGPPPPAKPGETPPPPRRSLRVLVLEPETKVEIVCPPAGLKLAANPGQPAKAESLPKGLFSLEIRGQGKGGPFSTTLELDLESPGRWTLFFIRDVAGQISPALQKDGSLD